MARIRTIKPEFFTDEDLGDLPPEVRLFFAGLWCQCDKSGRAKYKPRQLKAQILPFDNVSGEDAIRMLVEAGFVIQYEVDGESYLQVRTWDTHQRPHHTERDSELPPFDNGDLTVKERTEGKGREGKGKEGKGRERKGRKTGAPPSAAAPICPDLVSWCEWWNALHERGLVSHGTNVPPGEAIRKAHGRLAKSKELRQLLTDRDALEEAIRGSPFVNDGWFRLEKLLSGKNKDGELIARKLLDGGYRGSQRTQDSQSRISPGARYDPDRPCEAL
ncbi:hypothetical protein KJ912_04665 [Patescibacteria group bacterium]|nr:hypothetical protein [Patescibacteria group bacterium]